MTDAATHRCSTLGLHDLNLNHRGQFTFCCQLSSLYQSSHPEAMVVAGLAAGGIAAQTKAVAAFLERKGRAWKNGPPEAGDVNPCFYCLRSFGQVAHAKISAAA